MKSIGAHVVLKLVFAHGPLTRWTLTGQGIGTGRLPEIAADYSVICLLRLTYILFAVLMH